MSNISMPSGSSGEGQRPAVPSGYEHPSRRVCSMPRATGRTLALLPSGGSVNGGGASDEFFDFTGCAVRKPGVNMVDDHLADVRKLKDVLSDQRHCLAESRICRVLGKGGIGDSEIVSDDMALLEY